MFAVDGGFNRHKLAARLPAANGIDGFAHHMRNSPVDGPVDIKVKIAAELRAMRVATARSTQDDLNGLPDIIQPRTISPGACRAGCQNTEVVFMGQYCPCAGTPILKAFKKVSGNGD